MERTITIRQGEYRDDNLRIYVDEDGATITLFDRESLEIEKEIHEVMQEEIENFIPMNTQAVEERVNDE